MKKYSIRQAKTQLSKLIRKALNGEDVVIAKGYLPIIRLEVIKPKKRKLGALGGKETLAPISTSLSKILRIMNEFIVRYLLNFQSILEKLTLVSSDENFSRYPITCLW